MSPDSIVPDPGNPQNYNRYSYSLNNPINLVDPTGHIVKLPHDNPVDFEPIEFETDYRLVNAVVSLTVDLACGAIGGFCKAENNAIVPASDDEYAAAALDPSGLIPLGTVAGVPARKLAQGALTQFGDDALKNTVGNVKPFKLFSSPRVPSGWHGHHLVEKRFWRQLGFDSAANARDDILAVMLPPDFHIDDITRQLRELIPYSRTSSVSLQEIWNAHKQVYSQYEWGQKWLDETWQAYFANKGVTQ